MTCTIVGGAIVGLSSILLVKTLQKQEEIKSIGKESFGGQDPTSSVGPILLMLGIASGVGLMIYGISTTD